MPQFLNLGHKNVKRNKKKEDVIPKYRRNVEYFFFLFYSNSSSECLGKLMNATYFSVTKIFY